MNQCAAIFNARIYWALEHKTYNKSKAHHDLYSQLRLAYPDCLSSEETSEVYTVRPATLEDGESSPTLC